MAAIAKEAGSVKKKQDFLVFILSISESESGRITLIHYDIQN